jgi:NAD(P)-dependent dehydrogenase (short-subunit alcohol dehydrogenase family)
MASVISRPMSHGLFDLTGKVVLSTGANSGIGLGFLQGCAKQGADVVVWGRRSGKNAAALETLRALGAGRTYACEVDVADEGAVDAAFARTVEAMGRVDCVFANAGITSRAASFPDMTSEMYHELLNVNLHGTFYTLRAATRHMRERALAGRPGGSIVACGSLSIFHGLPSMEHYAAAKAAVAAIIRGIAVEMAQYGVRANMIAPGLFITGFMENTPQADADALIKQFAANIPMGRVGYISDIEGPAAYLASDASAYHTGDILVIDGGRMVR